jgi:hypothetical protein
LTVSTGGVIVLCSKSILKKYGAQNIIFSLLLESVLLERDQHLVRYDKYYDVKCRKKFGRKSDELIEKRTREKKYFVI